MRPAAFAVLAIVIVAVPLAALRSEEPADVRLALSARILRTEAPLALGLEPGEFRLLADGEGTNIDRRVHELAGTESTTGWIWSPSVPESGRVSASCVSRIPYREYETTMGGTKLVPTTIADGVLADYVPRFDASARTVTFSARMTVAVVVRPIPTFVTTLGGETVTIELPEILVRRVTEEIVVPLGRTAVYRADRTDYLLLTADESGS